MSRTTRRSASAALRAAASRSDAGWFGSISCSAVAMLHQLFRILDFVRDVHQRAEQLVLDLLEQLRRLEVRHRALDFAAEAANRLTARGETLAQLRDALLVHRDREQLAAELRDL